MTDKLETRLKLGKRSGRKVQMRANDLDQSITVAVPSAEHVRVGVDFAYEDVAALLGRDRLERMLQMVRRQERFSGVECLDDIDGSAVSVSDYHDVQEGGPPLPEKDGDETVEIKRKHLRALRKGANRYPYHSSVEEAIRETSECDLL